MSLPYILPDYELLRYLNRGFRHFVMPLAHELIRPNHCYQLTCHAPPRARAGQLSRARAAAGYLAIYQKPLGR